MARSGILYSDVARAANEVAAKGQSITVDNVRKMMGDTGSKSTIAPMLKQWKEEHHNEVQAAGAGLPESILNAVRGVYTLMQSDLEQEIAAMTAKHNELICAAKNQQETLAKEIQSLTTSKAALEGQLAANNAKLQSTEEAYLSLQLKLGSLQSEKDGLSLRLADRTQEVKELKQKNEAIQHQFEHFQTATANQRSEDRKAYQSRLTQMENELQLARKTNQAQENTQAKQEAEIQQLVLINTEIANNAQKRKEDLEAIQIKLYQAEFLCQELKQENFDLKKDLTECQLESQRLITSTAVSEKLQEMLNDQLKQSEMKVKQIEEEKQELISELINVRIKQESIKESQDAQSVRENYRK
ncbi:DNA-binding protein [Undibacterium sp. WLX3042]|uniref:DNA-binding protein n=1 Tax=Undibacterium sp. WLX3042 TaxID=3412686 RepID=UPI003C2D63D9